MTIKIQIILDKNEIQKAIINAVIDKIDIGIPFDSSNVSLYFLNLEKADLEIKWNN